MNWDNIKYLFQIPLEWFKQLHNRVFKAFGTNFIVVNSDGEDGGMHIDVDYDAFSRDVNDVVDLSGVVYSVDGIEPDQDGNVELSGYVLSVDGIKPDDNGNVELTGFVKSVDDIEPDDNGNVELTGFVKSVNGETPDEYGKVSVYVGVETVNNVAPDANGNVDIAVSTISCLLKTDWMNVNSNYSVSPYVYSNTAYTGNLPAGVTNLYSWVGALTYQTLDDCIYDLGYLKDTDLTDYVQFTDLTDYVQFTDLTDYVQQSELTDYALTSDLTNYALTSDLGELAYLNEDDLGDLAYMDAVTVDGHTSDQNGEVSFGLTPSKYLKSDAQGHITTTNDTPIAIDTQHYTPQTTNLTVITNVEWTGTVLRYKSSRLQFQQGVLVGNTDLGNSTIDTPVVITWS